jgi:hypothetical protein
MNAPTFGPVTTNLVGRTATLERPNCKPRRCEVVAIVPTWEEASIGPPTRDWQLLLFFPDGATETWSRSSFGNLVLDPVAPG